MREVLTHMRDTIGPLDYERLLRLRLVVGRFGEMDGAQWWNTTGMLGRRGAVVLSRGLPRTHLLAQAQVVFAVARNRCRELFQAPNAVTLWELPASVEDQFAANWRTWADQTTVWEPLFSQLSNPDFNFNSMVEALKDFHLVTDSQADAVNELRRSAGARAIQLPAAPRLDDDLIGLLAAGFAKGGVGDVAIPFVRLTKTRE